jgi:hypothetical protein
MIINTLCPHETRYAHTHYASSRARLAINSQGVGFTSAPLPPIHVFASCMASTMAPEVNLVIMVVCNDDDVRTI